VYGSERFVGNPYLIAFGEFFVRRLEIAADLIAVSSMIAVTLLLYGIFKPVNRGLSLLAASFNLVGLTFGALRWNPRGVDIPVVFDGFYCLLIGYLIFRSALLPRILGGLIACAGFGWLTFLSPSLAHYLSPYNLALGILGQGIGNAVVPHDGRKRTTMEGGGQPSGRVTNHSK
jgi:hypothetical protein